MQLPPRGSKLRAVLEIGIETQKDADEWEARQRAIKAASAAVEVPPNEMDGLIASVTGHYNSTPPTVYMTAETHSRLMQAATRGNITRMLDNVKRRRRAAQNRRTRRNTR